MIVRELIAKFGLDFDEKSFKKADNAVNDLKEGARHLLEAFAVFETIKTFAELVDGTTQAAVSVAQMAEKVGIGTDALQELRFAAKQSGIDVEQFDKALTLMTRDLGQASAGNTEAIAKFAGLGISIHDTNGKLKSADTVFNDVADKMAKAKTQTDRLRIATDLFGIRGGSKFALLMKDGAAGIERFRQEARDLGGVMDKDMIDKAEEAHHNFNRLTFAFDGIKNAITAALLPTIIRVTNGIVSWTKANQHLIKTRLTQWIEQTIRVGKAAISVFRTFYTAANTIVDAVGGIRNALIALGAAFGFFAIVQVGSAIGALSAFTLAETIAKAAMIADAALMGAAFLVIGAIIGLVAEEIAANFSDTDGVFKKLSGHWGELSAQLLEDGIASGVSWQGAIDIIGAVVAYGAFAIDNYLNLVEDATYKVSNALVDFAGDLYGFFERGIVNQIDLTLDGINNVIDAIKDAIHWIDALGGASEFKPSGGTGAGSRIWDFLNSPIGGSVAPSPAVAAATAASSGPAVGATSVSVSVDASGQSLDEGQVASLISEQVGNVLTTVHAQTISALTPSAVKP